MKWFAVAAALALAVAAQAGAGASPAEPVASPAPLVERSLLLGFLADNSTATLVDARSADEYAAQHVTGAVNIPHDQLDEHADRLPADTAGPVIIYCRSGMRASLLREQLVERGFTNVHVLPPRQMFWTDEVMVFNCGLTDDAEPAPAAVTATTAGGTAPVAGDGADSK